MERALNVKIAVAQEFALAPPHGAERAALANSAGSQSIGFSASELEMLLFIIDASLKLQTRPQFFAWSQGLLQSLVPHELLICALNDPHAQAYAMNSFYSRPFPEECLEELCRREIGTVFHLIRLWQNRHHLPLCHESGQANAFEDKRLDADTARFELGNLIAHGSCLAGGEAASFFVFACLSEKVGLRHAYLLDLLVPFMHAAWMRILRNSVQDKPGTEQHTLLTARELEILGWVYEGKSNIDIGVILRISPLTVKNHVQKILRKLDVQNRTQAVSKGIALKLLKR